MARALRIEYAGAVYHVYNRGIAGQEIFRDDVDHERFLKALSLAVERYHVLLHGYCLMSNHYHLLMETPEANLSRTMRHINGVYTQGHNRRHRRTGPLIQGRYKASLVEKDKYLLELSRYIVLNPVRAGMVTEPEEWVWSSYRATAGITRAPSWLTTDWLLSVLGGRQKGRARKRYRAFIREGMREVEGRPGMTWRRLIIGGEAFVQQVRERLEGRTGLEEIPRGERLIGRPSLESIFRACRNRPERDRQIYEAFERHGYRLKEIAEAQGLHYSRVCHIVGDERKKAK